MHIQHLENGPRIHALETGGVGGNRDELQKEETQRK